MKMSPNTGTYHYKGYEIHPALSHPKLYGKYSIICTSHAFHARAHSLREAKELINKEIESK